MATATTKLHAATSLARTARDGSEAASLQFLVHQGNGGDHHGGITCEPGESLAAHGPACIGAGEGPIEIVEYDPSWPASFNAERERLAPLLPGVQIHHIGSTAAPGLSAKAVIDMIALVDDLDANAAALTRRAGYQVPARFNTNLLHRRFLCYPTATHRTHHLHLVDKREDMDRCLRFRDSLRANPKLAADYAALKRALAASFREDREGYTEAKSKFINEADSHARSPASPLRDGRPASTSAPHQHLPQAI